MIVERQLGMVVLERCKGDRPPAERLGFCQTGVPISALERGSAAESPQLRLRPLRAYGSSSIA